jgi:tRNA threonylcarbamoyladenosine biosynthesis protein TsaE
MPSFVFAAKDLADTARLGRALAEALPGGSVVALSGTLGAGKTHLVQSVVQAEGVDPRDVTSPTFVLINEYPGRRPVYHFDAYRIKDDDEFLQLGPEEYFEGQGLTFVEWAERVAGCLPAERLEVRITLPPGAAQDNSPRDFAITAVGRRYAPMVERLRAALSNAVAMPT